jgi:hypothetical protein
MGQPRNDWPDEELENQDIEQPDTGWREMGEIIDHNAIRRAAEAVRAHEQRHHPSAMVVADEADRISDETLRSIIGQAEQEDCSLAYACECHDVKWSRFVVDIADYEGRMRKDLEDRRWGRR